MVKIFMISDYDNVFGIPNSIFIIPEDDKRSDDEIYCDWFRSENKTHKDQPMSKILDHSTQYWTSNQIKEYKG